ncbi:MAG: condensation domain-containing protein [Ruminococcus sp.]|nr:condensation domain-containing protein [Ruminococcus sp.]
MYLFNPYMGLIPTAMLYSLMPQGMGQWAMQQVINPQQSVAYPNQLCTPKMNNEVMPVQSVTKATKPSQTVKPIKKSEKQKAKSIRKPSEFTANNLTEEALDTIIGKYGIEIDDIYNLAPGQEWMFSQAKTVTSAFFTQALFKAVIKIKPSTLRQKVDEVCEKRDNLRTAFAYEGLEKPYQVVLKNRRAELKFYDISSTSNEELDDALKRIMDADRRRGFDLENDQLLRIAIYKTCDEDTYAILISQPHINNDGASTGILLKELFVDYALESEGIKTEELEGISFGEYAQWLENLDRTKEFDYWKDLLKDMPSLTVAPGYVKNNMEFDMSTKSLSFDKETNKKIRKMQGCYKATINNIMQTAWGVMLGKLYDTSDVTFGAITSGRNAEVKNSDMITGGMVNAVPVRIKHDGDMTFSELCKSVQKQFAQSLQYSHCSLTEIQQAIGRKEKIFDHLLNFHNFSGAGAFADAPKIPGIVLLGSESFDNLSTDLCVYFMMQKGSFVCNFTYNRNTFTDAKIDILMECFKKVVEQVAENNNELLISSIECPNISVFAEAEKEDAAEKQRISSFISGLDIFKGVDDVAIKELTDYAQITSYVTDDIIVGEKKSTNRLSFVMNGYVEIARESMDGWTNSLMSLRPGKMITVAGILDDVKSYTLSRAITDDVKILSFPKEVMWKYIERYPCIALNIIKELDNIGKTYSFLWLSSD